jgi:hypothetical protein
MRRLIGLQKKTVVLVAAFFFSCVQRTSVRVRTLTSPPGFRSSVPYTSHSLLIRLRRPFAPAENASGARHYYVELNGSFPFIHSRILSQGGVAPTLSFGTYLSEMLAVPLSGAAPLLAQSYPSCPGGGGSPNGNPCACTPAGSPCCCSQDPSCPDCYC